MGEIRVVLVDDHEMFREGVRAMLAADGVRIVYEASDARSLLAWLDGRHELDLFVVDIALPGSDGFALVRELRRRGVTQPVVVLSMHVDLDMVVEALSAGGQGYVFKSQSSRELGRAIRTLLDGQTYVPVGVEAARLQEMLATRELRRTSPLAALSAREREVCDLLIRGFGNAQIAAELCVSVKTVETHRTRIFKKLGVHSLSDLVRMAARHNLLAPTAERVRG